MLQEKLPCYLLGPRSTRNNQLCQGSGGAVAGQTAGPYTHLLKVLLACDMQGVKKESIFFLFPICRMFNDTQILNNRSEQNLALLK